RRTRKAGIATVVIRSKQYLATVAVHEEVIVLAILRYSHELRDWNDLDLPKGKEGVSERELEMAERLVEGMVSEWKPESYKDTYVDDLKAMIKRRVAAGQTEESPEPTEEEEVRPARGQVVDLMALLKQSVEEGSGGSKRTAARKAPQKAAEKKAAAKKTPAAKKAAAKRTASSSSRGRKKTA
ncbi:MAG: Ku protein, partial [Acidobacteriota bacterium]